LLEKFKGLVIDCGYKYPAKLIHRIPGFTPDEPEIDLTP
jgi:hypothetical protein